MIKNNIDIINKLGTVINDIANKDNWNQEGQLNWDALTETLANIRNTLDVMSCDNCKHIKRMGEDDNDLCNNDTGSSHPAELAAGDFCCNRWELKEI